MPEPNRSTPGRRLLRLVLGIVFLAASVRSFVSGQVVLGVLFLVVGAVFAGAAAVRTGGSRGQD